MQGTPHILAGAAIGAALGNRRLWLVIPLAFTSHLLLDKVPHLDAHAVFGIDDMPPTPGEIITSVIDGIIAIFLIRWLSKHHSASKALWVGGFFAILLDLLDNIPPWNAWFRGLPIFSSLSHYHQTTQWNVTPHEWILGISTQAIVIGLSIFLIFRLNKPPLPAENST